ncbi:restriction endonuclease subunit S [Pseudoalteromonas shioyasakiensis]|uniref:restriction endonuclease subunit S n=1 Tax=Pseudoalteromonas shioyasakiensis TaxID=1190813 RepID=UPI003B50718E
MVPNGWTLNNFNSVAELIHGFQFREHHFSESGVPIVKIASISHLRGVSLEKCSYISEEIASEFSKYQIEAGDVLMALTGGTLGKTCKVQEDIEICLQNYRVGNFKPKASFLDKDFLYYFLISFTVQKKIENIVNEAAQPNVGKADFDKIKVLTPPLPEQRKIAKILGTWDKAISTTERLIDNSKQQKKALMQQLLTGKKRFAGFSKDWKQIHLGDIGKCITGLTYKPTDTVDDGVLVLRSSNIQNSKLTFKDNVFVNADLKIKSKTQENDILVCVRNGSKNLIGKSTLIKGRAVGQAHGAFMTLFRGKHPSYVSQLFQSSEFFRQVNMNLGATINSINTSDLHKFKFTIPTDEDEINAIASCLSNAENEIEILQQQLADLKLEKKALMQQLLTGKRRVTVN